MAASATSSWTSTAFSLSPRQLVGLMLPTYQGKVIDDVFKQDAMTFKHDIIAYALGSLTTTILSALSSICVQIVQKNLEAGIRIKLFQAVLSQDIAFFDGMMTGEISSKIQNVSPLPLNTTGRKSYLIKHH